MANASNTALVDAFRQYRLLEPAQLEEVARSLQDRFPEPKALAGELIRRGWLTPFQANQLLQGRGQELLLGSYILLEKLGEGGMGQVFKGRNWKLGRIVALKLIRKERLDNPNAVRRFQREVRSAAVLSHPNIVRTYDADEIAGTHLMVMEYIEGAFDLAHLVKKNGPLPVPQACEYIRQAALGLQHAYEQGMVHRDIKPANLLLTAGGKVVKLLDMGLARLDHPESDDDDKSSTMTQEGAVMGTPDYIAPEQALDTHTVDIRGDLYSLGCAFYYLLTGRVPFPGGTLLQKLNKHQSEEPLAVENLRSEVSPGVAGVIRKLMAKQPVDRYQTPAELSAALASLGNSGSGPALVATANDLTISEKVQSEAVKEVGRDTFASAFAFMEKRDDTVAFEPVQDKPKNRRWLLVGAVGGSLALVGLAVALFLTFKGPAERKPPEKEKDRPFAAINPPKNVQPKGNDFWLKQVAAMPAEKQVEAVAKKLQELNSGFNGNLTNKGIVNGVVTEFGFVTDDVTDISPVQALPGLKWLNCSGTTFWKGKLSDLSPLKDLNLAYFFCADTRVVDLTPLKDMKLAGLYCFRTQVADLSPLKHLPLAVLNCAGTKVTNLSPLKHMNLQQLYIDGTGVTDLSPLKDMKLSLLICSVTQVSDLSPLKDMKLRYLSCNGTKVSDLSPLKGMPLVELSCNFKAERDAEILRSIKTLVKINGKPANEFWKEVEAKQAAFEAWCKQVAAMPSDKQAEAIGAKLKEMNPDFDGKVTHTNGYLQFLTDKVVDISAVRALPGLTKLICGGSPGKGQLADLSPLKGMPLTFLHFYATQVKDLFPLKDMKLTNLSCQDTMIADLSPLKEMKLDHLNCGGTQISDLLALKDMKLAALWCNRTNVSDLTPLKDMKLVVLNCDVTKVTDLSPLNGMKLESLNCGATKVSDLSPLKGMPLTILHCQGTSVKDLGPLRGMPLTTLWCWGTKVNDLSPIQGMPLKELRWDFKADRDGELLRSIKTLEKINGIAAHEFLK